MKKRKALLASFLVLLAAFSEAQSLEEKGEKNLISPDTVSMNAFDGVSEVSNDVGKEENEETSTFASPSLLADSMASDDPDPGSGKNKKKRKKRAKVDKVKA